MYKISKSKQTSFTPVSEIYDILMLKDHILYKINEEFDFSFINEICKDLYSGTKGRPVTNTPEMMLRSAVVQCIYNYSDRQMEYEAHVNIMVKWFIGLKFEDVSYDHSALGHFRDKLGVEKWTEVFDNIMNQIFDAGYSTEVQYVDATHVIADASVPGTVALIRQGITGVIKSLKKVDSELYKELGGKKQALKKEKLLGVIGDELQTRLEKIVEEALHVISKTEHFGNPVKERVEILKRILSENVDTKDQRCERRKGWVKNRLVSAVDTDARHGAKSDKKKFVGYKVNSSMTEDGFITNIKATPGNSYDGNVLFPLIDENITKGQKIIKVVADGAYGSADNRYEMLKRDATLVSPVRADKNPKGLYSQDMFDIDETGVTCPAGNRTMISNQNKKTGRILYYFKKDVCEGCILKEKCTKGNQRTVSVHKHHLLMEEAKRYNSQCEEYKDDLRIRAHIEPKQGEMKRYHGLTRAKYRGLDKVNIQSLLVGATVNMKRFVRLSSRDYQKSLQ